MTFRSRLIDVKFDFYGGSSTSEPTSSVSLSGLQVRASINNIAGDSMNGLQLQVFGMIERDMHQLSTLGIRPETQRRNVVTLQAGDAVRGMAQIFQGTIANAFVDYRGMPDVSLNVEAYAGFFEKVKAVAVNSYKGATDVATIIQSLANAAGFAFVNNGVDVKLESPYFAGSAVSQIQDCARAAGITHDISNGVVQIWPSGYSNEDRILDLSPSTGLVGYPEFTRTGVQVQCEFNPDIVMNRKIRLTSAVPQACGEWRAQTCRHEISAMDPNGPWFTYVQLVQGGYYVGRR